jgi:hypothetical protein
MIGFILTSSTPAMINLEKVRRVNTVGKEKIKINFLFNDLFSNLCLGKMSVKSSKKAGIKYDPIKVNFVQNTARLNVLDRSTK